MATIFGGRCDRCSVEYYVPDTWDDPGSPPIDYTCPKTAWWEDSCATVFDPTPTGDCPHCFCTPAEGTADHPSARLRCCRCGARYDALNRAITFDGC
jgi:hypothetical protein